MLRPDLDRLGNAANIRRYLPKVLLNILLEKKNYQLQRTSILNIQLNRISNPK
jgi:hypothetical protein